MRERHRLGVGGGSRRELDERQLAGLGVGLELFARFDGAEAQLGTRPRDRDAEQPGDARVAQDQPRAGQFQHARGAGVKLL